MKFAKEFNKEQLEQIKTMAAMGIPQAKIAVIMGISEPTFERMIKHREAVRDALELGRAMGSVQVHQSAYQMATSGEHPGFTAFWLKVREGWRETKHIDITVGGGHKPIEEMSPAERAARIDRLLNIRAKLAKPVQATPSDAQADIREPSVIEIKRVNGQT